MNTALELRGLGKRFGGQRALDGVDLTLARGEIHALLGSNGAGKSTLIKLLAGVLARDAGEILVAGRPLPRHHTSLDAARAGLAFVHQDLGLVETLSVAENLALELGFERRRGLVSHRATERRAAALLAELGVDVDPAALVGSLAQDEKVMVAVTRAVSKGAQAVVLDEVSSSLPAPEMERLAGSLRAAQRTGVAYVYVTHRLEEVFALADRVTVLRDGRRVATADVAGVSHDALVGWIIGKGVDPVSPVEREAGPVRLRVRGLAGPGLSAPVSLEIGAGEVLGVCGLIGSGSRAVARLLGGGAAPESGAVELDGVTLKLGDPHRLARAGGAYVPGDRVREGAVADLSVRENLFLTGRRRRRERGHATALAKRYDVRPRDAVDRPLATLSGGNQQKVVFARALHAQPRLLVLDDPTAGVDVGARAQLHGFIRAAADAGAAVLLASTDFDEVAGQADRVLVMRHGRVAHEITRGSADALARAAYTEVMS